MSPPVTTIISSPLGTTLSRAAWKMCTIVITSTIINRLLPMSGEMSTILIDEDGVDVRKDIPLNDIQQVTREDVPIPTTLPSEIDALPERENIETMKNGLIALKDEKRSMKRKSSWTARIRMKTFRIVTMMTWSMIAK